MMLRVLTLLLSLCTVSMRAERLEPVWPTPSTAYFEGKPLSAFVQPTASGEVTSGLYGCTRSGGAQFHEGLDIKPVARDRRGEATDEVFSILDGTVRHVSRNPGESSYGRYVVVEHTNVTPTVLTLYAHLASIPEGLKRGDRIARGGVLGIMGRSASGYAIPRERAHLHFEIGLWLTRDFQGWYNWKKFGSRNEHGVWNGMNLIGIDPLDVYQALRARSVEDFRQYFAGLEPAVKVRIATKLIPDFIERYPALMTRPYPEPAQFSGWEITVNSFGVPFSWTPLERDQVSGLKPNTPVAEAVNPDRKLTRCKSLVFRKAGRYAIGKDLESTLQLLFGLRKEL